jgi:hypothetical protein
MDNHPPQSASNQLDRGRTRSEINNCGLTKKQLGPSNDGLLLRMTILKVDFGKTLRWGDLHNIFWAYQTWAVNVWSSEVRRCNRHIRCQLEHKLI